MAALACCRGAGEGDGAVLARLRRGAAGAPGHAGDAIPPEPPTAVADFRAPGEAAGYPLLPAPSPHRPCGAGGTPCQRPGRGLTHPVLRSAPSLA